MNTISRIAASAALLLGFASAVSAAPQLDRMDPPFWYTGMKNTELQMMFYGPNISKADFTLEQYEGVRVKEISKTSNPNYLFVYLDVTSQAKPGTMTFTFQDPGTKKSKKTTLTKTFELKDRNQKVGALGFTPADVLYLIMPDRFSNGDPTNDNLDGYTVNRQNGGGRHGGDFRGIMNHLDYIDNLGVTAIWLNPVQYNKGNASHGYSITDYYMVDPRFGSNDEYCEFIDASHQKGLKVVMDMIFNHCGSNHWWLSDVPDADWFNQNWYAEQIMERNRAAAQARPGQGQQQGFGGMPGGMRGRGQARPDFEMPKTIAEFNALTEEQKAQVLRSSGAAPQTERSLTNTTHYKWTLLDPHAPKTEQDILVDGWFTAGMPDLNQRNRHLATYLIQNCIWWIEFSRIDGIRMDTYPYADYDFMVRWCNEVLAEYPDFNIVGEGWYPRNSAAGWWQRNSSINEKSSGLKTVMDFDLTFTAQAEMLKESNTSEGSEAGLFKLYETVSQDFLVPDPDFVLTFLDNHDISRFMQVGDPIWKFKQGIAFLLTSRGIPQIYYGTEIAMTGNKAGGDSEMRADFPGGWAEDTVSAFTKEGRTAFQNECWDFASKLLNWRRTSKPVTEGKLIHYTPDNNTKCYVYARTDGKNTVLVILNGSDTLKAVDMNRFSEVVGANTKGKDVVTGQVVDLTSPVLIEARGVYVLDLQK